MGARLAPAAGRLGMLIQRESQWACAGGGAAGRGARAARRGRGRPAASRPRGAGGGRLRAGVGGPASPARPGPGPCPERPPSPLQPRHPAGRPWRPSALRCPFRVAGAPRPVPPAGTPRPRPCRCPRRRRALPWAAALRAWSSRCLRSQSRGRRTWGSRGRGRGREERRGPRRRRRTSRCQRRGEPGSRAPGRETPQENPGWTRSWLRQPSPVCPPAPSFWGPQLQPVAQSLAWSPGRRPWCGHWAAAAAAETGAGTWPVTGPLRLSLHPHCPPRQPISYSGNLPQRRESRRQAEPEQSDGEEDFYYTELDVGMDVLTDGLSSLSPASPSASVPPASPRLELPEPRTLSSLLHPLALPPVPVLSPVAPREARRGDDACQGCLAPTRPEPQPTTVRTCVPTPPSRLGASPRKPRGDAKKCRKVYGMDHRHLWCTACRWKKACQRFLD
ncbi:SLC2A4 regulator isoform X1 [Acinonyx jubatus]|uniref:SLC2A4 regulator isoform X1 n=1 Tax=Acinonyx jubatus TaxID=32536 RepID=A0ABM3N8B1_ACIJB|nr:SLC2A4 regulator isoform X1 [Acinonyx jubatus]